MYSVYAGKGRVSLLVPLKKFLFESFFLVAHSNSSPHPSWSLRMYVCMYVRNPHWQSLSKSRFWDTMSLSKSRFWDMSLSKSRYWDTMSLSKSRFWDMSLSKSRFWDMSLSKSRQWDTIPLMSLSKSRFWDRKYFSAVNLQPPPLSLLPQATTTHYLPPPYSSLPIAPSHPYPVS